MDESIGAATFKKYTIQGTPTTLILGPEGAEIDWILGYRPPPENFQTKLQKILNGEETYKALSEIYANKTKDAATVFKLARKWDDRQNAENSIEKYKEFITLDPLGNSGTYNDESAKISVPYNEYAEFQIAVLGLRGTKPDIKSMQAFIVKYPKTNLMKNAYFRMSRYFAYTAPKDEATKYFEDYSAKFPNDPNVLDMYLSRIIRDKGPVEKGLELAEKIEVLMRDVPSTFQINGNLANFYLLKGDDAKAEASYGREYADAQMAIMAYNLVNYANFWLRMNSNQDSAVTMVETALKLMPNETNILVQAASAYVKANKIEKALNVYGPVYMQKNINDASALSSYASFWAFQKKNMDSALVAAKKSVELKPDQYSSWGGLSSVYYQLKNYSEAIKTINKAIELAPDAMKEIYRKQLDKVKAESQGKK